MARGKRRPLPHPPISVGNCKVEIDGVGFRHRRPDADSLTISFSGTAKINISVDRSDNFTAGDAYGVGGISGEKTIYAESHSILLLNPKDAGSEFLQQEILKVYMNELPSMNFAANTGKKSHFLERCVTNGKYKTLVLRSNSKNKLGEAIAALSFQIVPSDTQFAEIPLAAVSSAHQNKGFGRYLYEELKKRLQHVGVSTIFCWADKDSEGFWIKQGFRSVGGVNKKGRGHRLPIKAEIRRALCFPGGSTLMVASLSASVLPASFAGTKNVQNEDHQTKDNHSRINEVCDISREDFGNEKITGQAALQMIPKDGKPAHKNHDLFSPVAAGLKDSICSIPLNNIECQMASNNKFSEDKTICPESENCSCSEHGKKRVWESSVYSLKSKRVKGSRCGHCDSVVNRESSGCPETGKLSCDDVYTRDRSRTLVEATIEISLVSGLKEQVESSRLNRDISMHLSVDEGAAKGVYPRVMFMDIADETKKTNLTKIVENLGGSVTASGCLSTHVITGKARRTLNFCIALCSGSLVVSSKWLKESYREGIFLDGTQFLLEDADYEMKYKSTLKEAVIKAHAKPNALLKGYQVCMSKHVQPSPTTLSGIIGSAGGTVIHQLDDMREPLKTIFLATEEDMDEAFAAAKEGVWTYGSDWFMSCVMKQELDFEAPQFAESL